MKCFETLICWPRLSTTQGTQFQNSIWELVVLALICEHYFIVLLQNQDVVKDSTLPIHREVRKWVIDSFHLVESDYLEISMACEDIE